MRVLILSGTFRENADGVARTLIRFSETLDQQGIEHMVMAPMIDSFDRKHLSTYQVYSVPTPGYRDYRINLPMPRVWKAMHRFKPDVVHIATPDILGLVGLRFARKRKLPLFSTYHTHFPSYLEYYKLSFLESTSWRFFRWFYRRCRKVFVPTQQMQSLLAEHGISNTIEWGRGIERRLFNANRRDVKLRESWGGDDYFYVAYAGRLVWYKEVGLFRDVALKLAGHKKIRFVLFGDGPSRPELEASLPMAKFMGHVEKEDMGRMMASSDLLLFPSVTETFGQVVMEGLSCGLPTLVSDQGGPPEIVTKANGGEVIAAGDIDGFAKAILHYYNDQNDYASKKQNGIDYCRDKDWDTINSVVIDAYRAATCGDGAAVNSLNSSNHSL